MAWTDKPSDAQINALLHMVHWEITNADIPRISAYIEECKTRKEVSDELGRIKELKINRKLNKDTLYDSEFWARYEH